MLEIFAARSSDLLRHLTALASRLPSESDATARQALRQEQSETRGRLSVYTPALAGIASTDAAREYLDRVSSEAVHLLNDIQQPGETMSETEAAAPAVSGFYHETRYALALLDCAGDGEAKE